ncbi:MAG: hypothetical protein VXZ59_08190 [Cyanobacteriota bacterium]|nr:hypothetical protein [Cyanobacteriota bacterium]
MERQRIQSLIKQCSLGLFDLACAVSGHASWDLNLPVGVIDARRSKPKLMVTAVGTINSMVRASATIGHPLMKRFFERMEAVGLDQAMNESIGGADADAFAEVWQAYKDERRHGAAPMWSIEDATDFVLKSREAHTDREVACVAIFPGDPHAIVTFSVPIAFLTRG